jgi:hypothetical protein
VNEVHLVHKAAKVGASEATLLNMLNISPFTYGMVVQQVFDSGNVFAPSILDIEESSLLGYFTAAIQNVASVSLATGYPTIVSISHSLVNSYKNLLAVSVETDYDFEGSEKVILLSLLFRRILLSLMMFTDIYRLKRILPIHLPLLPLLLLHRMLLLLRKLPLLLQSKRRKRVMMTWAWIFSVKVACRGV